MQVDLVSQYTVFGMLFTLLLVFSLQRLLRMSFGNYYPAYQTPQQEVGGGSGASHQYCTTEHDMKYSTFSPHNMQASTTCQYTTAPPLHQYITPQPGLQQQRQYISTLTTPRDHTRSPLRKKPNIQKSDQCSVISSLSSVTSMSTAEGGVYYSYTPQHKQEQFSTGVTMGTSSYVTTTSPTTQQSSSSGEGKKKLTMADLLLSGSIPFAPLERPNTEAARIFYNAPDTPPILPIDPMRWSVTEVMLWLRWCSRKYEIPNIDPHMFGFNGKALCVMKKSMFEYRVPTGNGALILYTEVKNRKKHAEVQRKANELRQREREEQQRLMKEQQQRRREEQSRRGGGAGE